MTIINYTYGILTGGIVPPTSVWYRACFNVSRSKYQDSVLHKLTGNMTADEIGQFADTAIRFIQCSEVYPEYIKKYDPINTYQEDLNIDYLKVSITPVNYEKLLSWCSSIPCNNSEYTTVTPIDSTQVIMNGLFKVLTTYDNK